MKTKSLLPLFGLTLLFSCNNFDHTKVPAALSTKSTIAENAPTFEHQDLSKHFSSIKLTCGLLIEPGAPVSSMEHDQSFEDYLKKQGIIDVQEIELLSADHSVPAMIFKISDANIDLDVEVKVVGEMLAAELSDHSETLKDVPYISLDTSGTAALGLNGKKSSGQTLHRYSDMAPRFAGESAYGTGFLKDASGASSEMASIRCNLESTPK